MIQRMFLLAALAGAFAAPAMTLAQASAGMASPADIFDKQLSAEEKEIVGAAEAMPADKFDFAPTTGEFKGVNNFSAQVRHLAEANYVIFGNWGTPNAKSPADLDKLAGRDQILQALRDSFAFAHTAVRSITATNAFEQMGERKSTRAGMALAGLAHMMDHYGQMVEYLRDNGIVPPASRKS